ncbi:ImmA/IrrE family metallo-endopeptidase [Brevundimonas diminuta]|uniref:ImmA/IrrE family metallo-endopeptidase n=1 Tax=Brevundimonas diminuta TaxID=293 RepID=UPI0012FCE261|nr:ImmA/IrrE family metallo-endopeptidase [Brevundimonas diminuta]
MEFDSIPEGIDAVCVGLKSPGKRPLVIVDRNKPELRKRFTLGHELGHLLIPWHAGLIIDDIHLFEENFEESHIEAEANRFSSELLAPTDWINSNFDLIGDPAKSMLQIADKAKISIPAAYFRIATIGPIGLLFARESNGVLRNVGRTTGTIAAAPMHGSQYDPNMYSIAKHYSVTHGGEIYHWWAFADEVAIPSIFDNGDWRLLLAEIVGGLGLTPEEDKKFKQSLNGTLSNVNSQLRENRTPERMYSRILQRLHSAAAQNYRIQFILDHPQCHPFISARVSAFLT